MDSVLTIARGELLLRPWVEDDVTAIAEAVAASIEHLRPWMPWVQHEPLSDEDRRKLIVQWTRDREAGGDQFFGMFVDDVVVGGCGLHRRIGPGGMEIGYWVHVDHVGQGYATTAAAAMTDLAFADPDITRVEIHVDRSNDASNRVPQKLGFEFAGEQPAPIEAPAETGVQYIWRIERENWPGGM